MEAMTGLDAYGHRLAAITGCVDRHNELISGLTTVWGIWDSDREEWTDMQRLNIIGRLSGLYEFDDNAVLSEYGLPFLEEGQALALAHYWYQEASPDQEQLYLIRKSVGSMDTQEWIDQRQTMFDDADIDNDGILNVNEARRFF